MQATTDIERATNASYWKKECENLITSIRKEDLDALRSKRTAPETVIRNVGGIMLVVGQPAPHDWLAVRRFLNRPQLKKMVLGLNLDELPNERVYLPSFLQKMDIYEVVF